MRNIDILVGLEREINKFDSQLDKPSTDESLFWLNQAVCKFIKLRFNSDLVHGTSYEQNEKRREDLIKLYEQKTYTSTNMTVDESQPSYTSYTIIYPEDFMFSLNEDVVISDLDGENMYRVNNSLTDFHYRFHRARPLRVRNSNGCMLLTDKQYKISKYSLGYLRKPTEITLDNPYDEYEDFEDIIMPEIIKIAAQMYLENKKDERYKTITQEVNTQE